MAWTDVGFPPSKNINAAIYDADAQELLVEFSSGKVYKYSGVNGEMIDGFSQAQSATTHLQSVIAPQTTYSILK